MFSKFSTLRKWRVTRKVVLYGSFALISQTLPAHAQDQPLTLQSLLDSVVAFNPTLQSSRLQAQASHQDIGVAELQRWPTVSVNAETSSRNVASPPARNLRIVQTLWDAGRISGGISEAQVLAELSDQAVELQRQELFLQIVAGWQNLFGAREKISVAIATMEKLTSFQSQMQRRVAAEASSNIDLELVDSRLLQTRVELISAQSSLRTAIVRLEQLSTQREISRKTDDVQAAFKVQSTQIFADVLGATDLEMLASESLSVIKARTEVKLARTRLDIRQANNWPQVYARIDQPIGKPNPTSISGATVFIGLSYTPGAGLANVAQGQAQATRVASLDAAVAAAAREMQQALQNDSEEFTNSRARVLALNSATEGATLVLESYRRQFQAGRKSWLDLLNAVRELAQNQYAEVDAKTSVIGALHRLEIRMGRRISTANALSGKSTYNVNN